MIDTPGYCVFDVCHIIRYTQSVASGLEGKQTDTRRSLLPDSGTAATRRRAAGYSRDGCLQRLWLQHPHQTLTQQDIYQRLT